MAAAVIVARFWRSTGDRLFALMSPAFALFGLNRVVLGFLEEPSETRPVIYPFRLLAFAVILAAIVDRDRAMR